MRQTLLVLTLLLCGCADELDSRGCASPRNLPNSIVRIDQAQGSAVVIKPTEILTVQHVASAIRTSKTWRYVDISQRTELPFDVWNTSTVLMRVKRVFSQNLPEELHLLELQKPLSWPVSTARLREHPLKEGEPATGVGYARGRLRSGTGDFVSSKFALQDSSIRGPLRMPTFAGFKLTSTNEQRPLTVGSSGGGIFDCSGSLVATTARAYSEGASSHLNANVFAVPVHSVAKEISR